MCSRVVLNLCPAGPPHRTHPTIVLTHHHPRRKPTHHQKQQCPQPKERLRKRRCDNQNEKARRAEKIDQELAFLLEINIVTYEIRNQSIGFEHAPTGGGDGCENSPRNEEHNTRYDCHALILTAHRYFMQGLLRPFP